MNEREDDRKEIDPTVCPHCLKEHDTPELQEAWAHIAYLEKVSELLAGREQELKFCRIRRGQIAIERDTAHARIAELEGLLRESEVKLLAETQATNLLKRIRTALRESEG